MGRGLTPAPRDPGSSLVYGAAFALVLLAAITLGVGLLSGGAREDALSLAASLAAIVLLAVGVVRSSSRPRDGGG